MTASKRGGEAESCLGLDAVIRAGAGVVSNSVDGAMRPTHHVGCDTVAASCLFEPSCLPSSYNEQADSEPVPYLPLADGPRKRARPPPRLKSRRMPRAAAGGGADESPEDQMVQQRECDFSQHHTHTCVLGL